MSKIINPIKEFNGMFIKFNTVNWLLAGTHTDGWLDDTQAGWHTH